MTMHHDASVISIIVEEGASNPAKVLSGLLLDRNAGTNACVDEKVSAKGCGVRKPGKKLQMLFRNRSSKEPES